MEILKKLREEKNLRQTDVAHHLGISYQALANYENGHRSPDKEMLIKIADFYSVSVDYLLGRAENTQKEMPAGFPTDISQFEQDLRKVNFPVDKWAQLSDEQQKILLSTIENFIKSNK